MSDPNRSARVLGQDHGLTATEMNFLLKAQGLLEGAPGRWGVTEKGSEHALEQHVHRGTGGYPSYNRHYDVRTWAASVLDELDLGDEQKRQARDDAREARLASAAERAADAAACDSDSSDSDATDESEVDLRPVLAVAAVAVLAILVIAAAPRAKTLWVERAAPGLKRLRQRRQATAEPEPPAGDDITAP